LCLTCRELSPNVGDYGFLGAPESEPLELCPHVAGAESLASFGFLYGGLAAIGLRRHDLERFRLWLMEHAGHRLALDMQGVDVPEVQALEAEGRLKTAAGEHVVESAPGFSMARIEYSCKTCAARVASNDPELLMDFEPRTLSPAEKTLYLTRCDERYELK
jgi:hypothetical protein